MGVEKKCVYASFTTAHYLLSSTKKYDFPRKPSLEAAIRAVGVVFDSGLSSHSPLIHVSIRVTQLRLNSISNFSELA